MKAKTKKARKISPKNARARLLTESGSENEKRKRPHGGGRPTHLTPTVQGEVLAFVRTGSPVSIAGPAAGIPLSTIRDWCAAGRRGQEPYATFVAEVERARNFYATQLVQRIDAASKKDWRAAGYILERSHPEEFAPPSKMELTGKGGAALIPKELAAALARRNQKKGTDDSGNGAVPEGGGTP